MLLENEKIRLRAIEPNDLEQLYIWENDPDIWMVGNARQPYSKFILKQYIINSGQDIYENKQLRLMLVDKGTNKNVGTVKLISNGLTSVHNSIVVPNVVLYLNSSLAITADIVKMFKDTIGKILHKYIESRSFTISDIRNSIVAELGSNVLGVKISKITNDDREIVTVAENSNVFTLSKELFVDNNNNIDMTYNIDLVIES